MGRSQRWGSLRPHMWLLDMYKCLSFKLARMLQSRDFKFESYRLNPWLLATQWTSNFHKKIQSAKKVKWSVKLTLAMFLGSCLHLFSFCRIFAGVSLNFILQCQNRGGRAASPILSPVLYASQKRCMREWSREELLTLTILQLH